MTYGDIEKMARREINDEVGRDADRRVQSWQMLAYANEAQDEACLRSRLLIDSSTAAICNIAIEAGTAIYAYDPRIIFILRGQIIGANRPLSKVSRTIIDEHRPNWQNHEGEVECFVTGMNTGKVTFYRKPSTPATLNLTVVRRALQPMAKETDTPEINSLLHLDLILWIKHKVYNNQDSELFDKNRADVHLAAFEQKFGQRPPVIADVFDQMQIPDHLFRHHHIHHHDYGTYY